MARVDRIDRIARGQKIPTDHVAGTIFFGRKPDDGDAPGTAQKLFHFNMLVQCNHRVFYILDNVERSEKCGEKRFTPGKCCGSVSEYNDEPMDKSQESNYIQQHSSHMQNRYVHCTGRFLSAYVIRTSNKEGT